MKTSNLIAFGLIAFLAIALAGCGGPSNITANVYVQDEMGNKLTGAFVNAYTEYRFGNGAGNKWTTISGTISASGKTNEMGYAELELPTTGSYAFSASKEGYEYGGTEQTIGMGTNTVKITLKSSTPVTSSLKISVLDEQENLIPANLIMVQVEYCTSDDPSSSCQISEYVQLGSNPQMGSANPGRYTLSFKANGYEEARIKFTLYAGKGYETEVVMKKANQLKPVLTTNSLLNSSPTEKELSNYGNQVGEEINEKVNNSITKILFLEGIGNLEGPGNLNVDAKFSTDQDIKDLIATIGAGDFTYQVTLSPALDLGKSTFVDSSADDVTVRFFNEKYTLDKAVLTGQKMVRLVKTSAIDQFSEGDVIEALLGDGQYLGQEVQVKVKQIVASGAGAGKYEATFQLLDSSGKVIDTRTVPPGSNLKDYFRDSQDNLALASNLYVKTVAVGATTGEGYVEILKNSDMVELWDGKIYPYASNYTKTRPYSATIAASGNKLEFIRITNTAEKWEETSSGYDLGPLYPTNPGQSLTGKTGTEAYFGQSWPEGTLGKGLAKVEFTGFKNSENKSNVKIGKEVYDLPSGSVGGVSYRADDDSLHNIPFYIKLDDSNGTFEFEGKPYSVFFNFGSGGKTGTYDLNFTVNSGDYVNGRQWTINNGRLTIAGYYSNMLILTYQRITIEGTNYEVYPRSSTMMDVKVDLAVEIFYSNVSDNQASKNSATAVFNTQSGTYATKPTYGRIFLSNNSVLDLNGTTLGLYGVDSQRRVYYVPNYNGNDLWLLLEAQQFNGKKNLQYGNQLWFFGTSVPWYDPYTEVRGVSPQFALGGLYGELRLGNTARQYGYYVPKTTDFNFSTPYSAANAYFVAEFRYISSAFENDPSPFVDSYIDTAKGAPLGPFPVQNLSAYPGAISYNRDAIILKEGSDPSFMQAMYSDAGDKYSLGNGTAYFTSPEKRERVQLVVSHGFK